MKRWAWGLVGWLLLGATAVALAQGGYPEYLDVYVNDYADVITATDEANIRAELTELFDTEGIEMVVLTINSIDDYGVSSTIEGFATNLFNTWGIGDALTDNGVLLLVAVDDRALRIELGSGYGSEYNGRMQRIIDRDIIPYFQDGNMSLGIYEGVRAIKADLTGAVYESVAETSGIEPEPVIIQEPLRQPTTSSGGANAPWGWLGGGATAVAASGAAWYQRRRRRKPQPCPECGTMMARLDEHADDAYLDEGEQAEERVNSVDYDIWLCPNCQHYEENRYQAWFSKYKNCRQCGYRTMYEDSHVTSQPTTYSSGTRQHEEQCVHCDHHRVWNTTIARIQQSSGSGSSFSSGSRSSSSSRSSFGGGRSSGGGASGKW